MTKFWKNTLRFVLFFGLGILLFWLAYRNIKIETLKKSLEQANLWWIGLSLVLGLISHVSRTLRWRILMEPLGSKPGFINTFFAVMVMYLANLALPRLGEISRCTIIDRYEKVPFSKALGTVFLERMVDMVVLLLMLVFVVITQFKQISQFLVTNVNEKLNQSISNQSIIFMLIIMFVLGLIAIWLIFVKFKHTEWAQKIIQFGLNFWEGMKTIAHMKKKGWFIFHSFFIFFLYYLMIYVCFFAFDFTSGLNPLIGLTVFVMASLGMVVPVPGGIGAWHFMTFETLAIYGIPVNPQGAAFAFAVHESMTLMLIVVGAIALILLPIINKHHPVKEEIR